MVASLADPHFGLFRGAKRRNSDFAIRVLPVLCMAGPLTMGQLEEKMPVR
jgi:hypothetical protein